MAIDSPSTVDGVQFFISFDDAQPEGADAKIRVFTKGAVGRKVWLKVYNRALERIVEIPLRKGVDPEPPTVWETELDLAIPGIPIFIEREGPLSRYLTRRKANHTKEELEALVGRKIDDSVVGYPDHGLSLKVQVWR